MKGRWSMAETEFDKLAKKLAQVPKKEATQQLKRERKVRAKKKQK